MKYRVLGGFVLEDGEFAKAGAVIEIPAEHVPVLLARGRIEPVKEEAKPAKGGE